jgi:pSer/pThr/pTyr-binding forkhead associated (FHA) protein
MISAQFLPGDDGEERCGMNESINRRELTLKALAGLVGGAVGWLPVELASHGHSITEQLSTAAAIGSYVSMMLLSGFIGGAITAVEGQSLQYSTAMRNRFLRGFAICFVVALFSDYVANSVFSSVLQMGGWSLNHAGSDFALFMGRVISWVIMGGMLGVGVGIATFNLPNLAKGGIGGLIGGLAGGALFDPTNYVTGGGLASRLIGLSLIGLAIGLLIGLVQELTKDAWVTVEQGRLRGRQYRVEGARATIGRAEENPIGLFGDTSVQQRHAVIERRGADYVIRNIAVQDGTFVNGKRIETVDLHDGDRIGIGGYELTFRLRQGSAPALAQAGLTADRPSDSHVAVRLAGNRIETAGPSLVDSSGQRYPVRADAATTLGRALDNDIVVNHASVSRHHASIAAANGRFEIKDLNSQNGTFVGDRRVTQTAIADGDAIRLGQAPFTFRA